eukprot:3392131-Amphidinium_carterae.1
MVRSKWHWVALSKLQNVQLRFSSALLWMQSGCKTWRSCTTSGNGQEADPLFPFQTLGGARTPTRRREGSGDPFSAAAGSGAQEETGCTGLQGAPCSGPTGEAQSSGSQAHHHAGQASGVARGPAGQGPATPERAGHDPHR